MTVEVAELSKTYRPGGRYGRREGAKTVLDEINLAVGEAEMVVVAGPSGSGKTTLLRCIAGLESPNRGRVLVAGSDVTRLPPGDRLLSMVFQEPALYPHMDAGANIAFALRAAKVEPGETERRVNEAANMLGIQSLLRRSPAELSGGERQRVALGRALVRRPKAYLMDEPLSSLDTELRVQARSDLRRLQAELGTATLYVTHDHVEAMTMGDRVAVLHEGRIEQVDPPLDLYRRPATSFVARTFGNPPMNLFAAGLLRSPDGVQLFGLRPEHITVTGSEQARITGKVKAVEQLGYENLVEVEVGKELFRIKTSPEDSPAPGSKAGLDFADEHLHRFGFDGKSL